MRTKTLLCAAALAAGVATSMAQSNVYSLNIVGYANVFMGSGPQLYANPFNLDGTNSASQVLNLAPIGVGGAGLDSIIVSLWTGSSFNSTMYESDFPGAGWSKDGGNTQSPAPLLPPGTGFFLNNPGSPVTNTFVGQVFPAPSTTNGLTLGSGPFMVGSMLPVAGTLVTNTPMSFPLAPLGVGGAGLDSVIISTFTGSSYNSTMYESDFPGSGWSKDGGNTTAATPSISIGQGFFVNNSGAPVTWFQSLNF
jgi:hypothetical protein